MFRRKIWMPIASVALLSTGCSDDTVVEEPGEPAQTQTFEACEDQDFEIEEPVEGRAWTPNAITMVSEKIADGVFVVYDDNASQHGPAGIPLATTGGFIVGDDGVLLVESMINRQLFCQVVDLIRGETDKPLLYVINTSHHGDHSYGNHFLPEGVKVVQHENTAAFINDEAKFAADVAFMEANFGDDQGIDEVEARAADIEVDEEGWSVDLGGVQVEALYLGFGQTDGDLFVHVPDADLLFLGNPVVAQAPAIPWLLDGHAEEVLETLTAVREMFPDATLVPGHDAPQSATVLDFPIDYLEALLAATQDAVDTGETVEEASESVTLDDFQGYALWDWVHKSVNVPATFAELGGE